MSVLVIGYLMLAGAGLLIVLVLAITSKGECYYCGCRLEDSTPLTIRKKKWCGKCHYW